MAIHLIYSWDFLAKLHQIHVMHMTLQKGAITLVDQLKENVILLVLKYTMI